jgi:Mrp family chromosome partitioning ATPase
MAASALLLSSASVPVFTDRDKAYYADANLVQALVDAIIVVARTGVSRTDMVSRAIQRLPRQKILGTILTGVDAKTLATK